MPNTETNPLSQSLFATTSLRQPFFTDYLDSQMQHRLTVTCHNHHAFFAANLSASKLLKLVMLGQEDKARTMIEANPALLLMEARFTEACGRKVKASPFRAALAAKDICMVKMMCEYVGRIPKIIDLAQRQGRTIEAVAATAMLQQFKKQFPDGIDGEASTRDLQPTYIDILERIIVEPYQDWEAAVKAWRDSISVQGEIKTGFYFNLSHVIAAHKALIYHYYADRHELYRIGRLPVFSQGRLSDDQVTYFWKNVIGVLQTQLPAFDALVYLSAKFRRSCRDIHTHPIKRHNRELLTDNAELGVSGAYQGEDFLEELGPAAMLRLAPISTLLEVRRQEKLTFLREFHDKLQQHSGLSLNKSYAIASPQP